VDPDETEVFAASDIIPMLTSSVETVDAGREEGTTDGPEGRIMRFLSNEEAGPDT